MQGLIFYKEEKDIEGKILGLSYHLKLRGKEVKEKLKFVSPEERPVQYKRILAYLDEASKKKTE